jgi:hypothetical protein
MSRRKRNKQTSMGGKKIRKVLEYCKRRAERNK